jgi:arginyl-tRNA synthetase
MKDKVLQILKSVLGDKIIIDLTVPEDPAFGHFSTNYAMRAARDAGKKQLELAGEVAALIAKKAPVGFFEKVEAVAPGFINFWLTPATIQEEFAVAARAKDFGRSDVGGGKKIIVEYSQPNIAKRMHLGHFRNTMIGDAVANIFDALGYEVIRWNYLGDWGTQFGKLIAAYKLWGDKTAIEERPIEELQKLYVRFHDEMKSNPELEKQGQEEFQKLETGDKENRKLWEWFKKESLIEFEKIYKTLGVNFDIWIGESFFEEQMKPITKELLDKNIAERSEGAVVVKLDEYNLPPALIEKSDGASLYLTRDIANLRYRLEKYKPAKILYVVANDQSLHFEQLFAVAKKMGIDGAEVKHLKYGLSLGEAGKKLSTREGRTILVEEVLEKAITLSRQIVEEKARDLSDAEKDAVAGAVGIGALKFNDLKENRLTDIVFDWDKMLDFTGDSGPYLQYTYARLKSILRKAQDEGGDGVKKKTTVKPRAKKNNFSTLDSEVELALMRKIFELPDVVQKAGELYATSLLATYLHRLAVAANQFYEATPILKDEDAPRRAARLVLVETAARTVAAGLALLGIKTLEKI